MKFLKYALGGIAISTMALMSASSFAQNTIKIGGLLETSGFLAFLGKPGLEGAQLAVDEVNAAGGINGKNVEFININSESNNTVAVTAAKRLAEREKVVAIVGAMNSGASYAIINNMQRIGMPVVANGGSRGIVLPPEKKQWFFLAPLTDVLVQRVMMKHMKANGISKIAFLNVDTGFGTSGRKSIEAHAAGQGIQVAIQQTMGNKDKDVTPQLTKIRSSDAQATVIWATGGAQAIAVKNYRQLGLKKPLYISHAGSSFGFIKLAGNAANGVMMPSSKLYVTDSLSNSDPQKSVIIKFIAAYKKKYGKLPATFAGNGYDAATIVMNAIKKVGTNKAKIRDAIEGTKNYVGITAVYSYSPTNHFGAQQDSVVMLSVKNSKFTLAK